jgi:hypothetical protein
MSTRLVTARDYTVVRVRTADGGEGIGFYYSGSRAGMLVTYAVRKLFAPSAASWIRSCSSPTAC